MDKNEGIKVIPLDISDAWDNKTSLKEQAKRIISTAKDEKRDLTKAENDTILSLIGLADQVDEKIYRMAGVKMDGTDDMNSFMNPTSKSKNIWGATAQDLVRGNYTNIATRGLTSTTGSAVIQNPSIMKEYIGNLAYMNPLTDLGVTFENADNYSQWPMASGEPVVSYQGAEGDALSIDTAWSLTSTKATYATAAVIIKTSKQLLLDGMNVPGIIDRELTVAFQNSILVKFMQGSGTAEPYGLDNLSGINTFDLNGSAYDYDDYMTWTQPIISGRRPPEAASFLHGGSSWAYYGKLKDDQSRYLSRPDNLIGQIWKTSGAVKEDYASTRTKIYGGDFTNSRVIFQSGPGFGGNGFGGIQVLDQLYAGTFEVGFLAWLRYDIKHFRAGLLLRVDGVPLT